MSAACECVVCTTYLCLFVQEDNALVTNPKQLLRCSTLTEPSGRWHLHTEEGTVISGERVTSLNVQMLCVPLR